MWNEKRLLPLFLFSAVFFTAKNRSKGACCGNRAYCDTQEMAVATRRMTAERVMYWSISSGFRSIRRIISKYCSGVLFRSFVRQAAMPAEANETKRSGAQSFSTAGSKRTTAPRRAVVQASRPIAIRNLLLLRVKMLINPSFAYIKHNKNFLRSPVDFPKISACQ